MTSVTFEEDEIFVGPVTQRELIITWKKRQAMKLKDCEVVKEMDCAVKNQEEKLVSQDHNDISNDTSSEASDENFEFATENLSEAVTLSPVEKGWTRCSENKENSCDVQMTVPSTKFISQQLPKNNLVFSHVTGTNSILRAPVLKFESSTISSDWTKRINMNKIAQPTLPAYVQPLQSLSNIDS